VSSCRFVRFILTLALGAAVACSGLVGCSPKGCPRYEGQSDGPCGDDHFLLVEVGEFHSKSEGVRAAIKRLAAETRCPDTPCIRVMWSGPPDDTSGAGANRQALVYWQIGGNGQARWLGYEHDFLSGASGKCYFVDRAAIQAVADKSGTLEDFDQYDQSAPSGWKACS
jgi:hypothetical protein